MAASAFEPSAQDLRAEREALCQAFVNLQSWLPAERLAKLVEILGHREPLGLSSR